MLWRGFSKRHLWSWLSIFQPVARVGELWMRGKHPGVSQEMVGMETSAFRGAAWISCGSEYQSSMLVNSGVSGVLGSGWEGADTEEPLSTPSHLCVGWRRAVSIWSFPMSLGWVPDPSPCQRPALKAWAQKSCHSTDIPCGDRAHCGCPGGGSC